MSRWMSVYASERGILNDERYKEAMNNYKILSDRTIVGQQRSLKCSAEPLPMSIALRVKYEKV